MRIEVGAELPTRRIDNVSPETMKAWAPILRDPNPIHLDRDAVRAKGLGDRLINQGPINLGYCMDMLQAAFAGATIEEISNRFVDNVYEGDALTASGEITQVVDRPHGRAVRCDFRLRADERDLVITGSALIALAD
jgi:acyl dehydratase